MPTTAAGDTPRHTNRLAAETSPYLLQHAHNPVDWWPWGPDALARAKLLDRPIFLSIGYAACHWCHVMERESFEDEATAEYLNARFIPIKVDREERPDLDQVYMAAVQAMTGGGGWPMSVFLTPDGRPFYGGTYFPDEPRHGMPSFRQVLEGVDRAWREDREGVERQRLQAGHGARRGGEAAGRRGVALAGAPRYGGHAHRARLRRHDRRLGRRPEVPPADDRSSSCSRARPRPGDPRPLAVARRTLDAMAAGGIHDQLGGGFHRYATDRRWLVPHFEQMLYDNAQLARVVPPRLGGDRRRALPPRSRRERLEYLLRELMRTGDCAFAASQDADTEGEEGATFIWTAAEIRDVLGERQLVALLRGCLRRHGGRQLGRANDPPGSAPTPSSPAAAGPPGRDQAQLAGAHGRALPPPPDAAQPARDDKALAAWNGLAIAAFADAARHLRTIEDRSPRPTRNATRSRRFARPRPSSTVSTPMAG